MRRIRAVGLAVGCLALVGGCANSTGAVTGTSPLELTRMSRAQRAEWLDSVSAQAVANAEGPGVSIRAEFSNVSGSRRVRGMFHLDDDAYVLIGHIDADGVLRVVFPMEPNDEGLVKGDRSYKTNEFFAKLILGDEARA